MYDNQYFLVPNAAHRYSLSSRDKFTYNPDGSMDVSVQKESPEPAKPRTGFRLPMETSS